MSPTIAPIADRDIAAVIALWQRCDLTRPWNDPASDIAFACRGEHATVLVGREGDRVVATVMVGDDGHRGWVYYLAVDPDQRRGGLGRVMMGAAEQWLRNRGVEKLQLMVRAENPVVHAFYNNLGYAPQERVVFARWLDGRDPTP